ncbi:hypothetical protein SLEP1_g27662 [Rubroshorea leprosula]|uniref:Uncharacterized protein n=1 Tax=Rubroshorea leprosula TaxID=152421 RepID=A0AAV5JY79_9ROSI|nr:hypothetical protein SLEP1_g27662 [Rubroshorea leprosula]
MPTWNLLNCSDDLKNFIFLEILHGFVSDIVMITDASQWEFVNAGTCRHVY